MKRPPERGDTDSSRGFTFTVFTPTYNRAHTLNRVYFSLREQTFRDFEWLIVDDGSTDHTHELITRWQGEAEFPIRYYRQENLGKPLAFNKGVGEARGELLLLIDSDDGCVPEALEQFNRHWKAISEKDRDGFVGVTGLCMDQNGNLVGDKFPSDLMDSDSLEIRYKFKVKGEKWGFLRTEVLSQYPFPMMPESKFVPEGIIWSAIAKKYKTRFINTPLRIYWSDEGRTSDQLSRMASPALYAAGHAYWHRVKLNTEIHWFQHAPLEFLRSAVHYGRFSFHNGVGFRQQLRQLDNLLAKGLWLMALPVASMIFSKDPK
jgi:glycosyltransferase involved in cell wall biosynthesis